MKITTILKLHNALKAGKLIEHHTSLCRGYQSRLGNGTVVPYSGRFGVGAKWLTANRQSSVYCYVTYYVRPI